MKSVATGKEAEDFRRVMIIRNKLTNSVELSTAREATTCAATRQFPAFYGTRRFITEFTRALHLYLS
jgi:hypothetical protein